MVHTASVIPAAMPGVTVATAWAIQQSDFTETLEANCLLPGPISREGISALRHTYCRTPSPDDRAKRRTPCVFIHAIEGHHPWMGVPRKAQGLETQAGDILLFRRGQATDANPPSDRP